MRIYNVKQIMLPNVGLVTLFRYGMILYIKFQFLKRGVLMFGFIMFALLLIFSIVKFYKNRSLFKQLSKKEWIQFIVGFLFAWAVAVIIIIGGSKLTDTIQIAWLNKVLAIIFILIGLAFAGFIMNKFLPEKLKEFYS